MREKRNCQELQRWSRTRASERSPIGCCRLGVGGESGLKESLRKSFRKYKGNNIMEKQINTMPDIKIFVVCHKPSYVPKNPYLYPIQVGTALASNKLLGMHLKSMMIIGAKK